MTLYGNDIVPIPPSLLRRSGVRMISLKELCRRSDFVSLNCDLNPTSHHLIDAATLAGMKPGAVLINTARGPVIDEGALVEALAASRIAGAALDVFEDEPLPAASPLRRMENVLLGAHNANSSPEAWARVHRNTLRNLLRGLRLAVPAPLQERRTPSAVARTTRQKERR
jgi:D-3-phosphoglycerate dehydrogenase